MLTQREQLCLCISYVPNCYTAVHTPRHHQVRVERGVVYAHDLSDVSLDVLADLLLALVPNLKSFVVTHARKLMQVKVVPGNILHYLRVSVPLAQGVDRR